MPDGSLLEKVLKEMDSDFETVPLPYQGTAIFQDLDEAVSIYTPRFFAETDGQKGILREYLAHELEEYGQGLQLPIFADSRVIFWKSRRP